MVFMDIKTYLWFPVIWWQNGGTNYGIYFYTQHILDNLSEIDLGIYVIVNEHNNNDKIVHCLNFELKLKLGTNRSKEKFVPAKYAVWKKDPSGF